MEIFLMEIQDRQEFFQDLGFNEYESKILSALVILKKASPKEISLASKVPQNKIYSIIGKLKSLDLVAEIPNEIKKYALINLETFIKNKIKEKQEKVKKLEINSKILEKLEDKQENFSFQIIIGQKAIMNKLAETNKICKHEILGVQRNWKYWAEGIRAMESGIKRQVKVKLIGEINPHNKEKVKEWKKIGCEIRAYNKKFGNYPLRFSLFDFKYARITIGSPEISRPEDYITIWTDSKPLIKMLRNQFMQMWRDSEKF